jgi:hypothetical protein
MPDSTQKETAVFFELRPDGVYLIVKDGRPQESGGRTPCACACLDNECYCTELAPGWRCRRQS